MRFRRERIAAPRRKAVSIYSSLQIVLLAMEGCNCCGVKLGW